LRILTILGTRPEIIRLSAVIELLDREAQQTLAFTGQNSDPKLSNVFFQELAVRQPDLTFDAGTPDFADQVGRILSGTARAIEETRPDRILILGDTNSGLASLVAARRGIPVYHMEAGNRCYDDRVPEEVNRRVIDHCSAVLLPYTHRSKENLVREGIERERVFVTGNPIAEVIDRQTAGISASRVLETLGLRPGAFGLATVHRAETVDIPETLASVFEGLSLVADEFELPLIVSVHPRTRSRLKAGSLALSARLRLVDPLGFFDFVRLEREARLVLSDSGTVQEECAILRVPSVTLREVTERPETIECGSCVLAGTSRDGIRDAARRVLARSTDWSVPAEYLERHVSRTVVNILLGRHRSR
jgi:UDP-N-acetylglucosamine 2-epimerase (non-hydrolysing)